MASIGKFAWSKVPGFIAAQIGGAFTGAILVWLHYRPHFDATPDKCAKLGVFCTAPAIRDWSSNMIGEFIGTFVLVFGILGVANTNMAGGISPLVVGAIVFVVGLTLGGTTGYAINPARDLGPRIAHAVLPIKDKGDSDWGYSWLPVIMPILGGVAGALIYNIIF